MKHVDLCFVREKVQIGQMIVNFVRTSDKLAGILTKPLTKSVFLHFRSKLGVMDMSSSSESISDSLLTALTSLCESASDNKKWYVLTLLMLPLCFFLFAHSFSYYHPLSVSFEVICHLYLILTCVCVIVWFCFETVIRIDLLVVLACIYFTRSTLDLCWYSTFHLILKLVIFLVLDFLSVIMCCICMFYLANMTTYFPWEWPLLYWMVLFLV